MRHTRYWVHEGSMYSEQASVDISTLPTSVLVYRADEVDVKKVVGGRSKEEITAARIMEAYTRFNKENRCADAVMSRCWLRDDIIRILRDGGT